jgi:hypothetical protein
MFEVQEFPCPYKAYPAQAYWSRSIAKIAPSEWDPVVSVPFQLREDTKIATAGSCFAQHIARYLQQAGYNYFVTEKAPSFIPMHLARKFNFGVFSAKYANIYTVRQLLQLFLRAFGEFSPIEEAWSEEGAFVDPFRPTIQPGGFVSLESLIRDRRQHFAAVRRMFVETDVFVFTLGLTEAWRSRMDGAVFPLCPGCGAGAFDPEYYEFYDADYEDILADARDFLARLRRVNPKIKIILTVSPVPLVATATGDHVLSATVYSKSVLRAVAGKLAKDDPSIAYFPSYEIVTSSGGRYFGSDLRNVTEEGVLHVMKVFFRHFLGKDTQPDRALAHARSDAMPSATEIAAALICEEEMLDPAFATGE